MTTLWSLMVPVVSLVVVIVTTLAATSDHKVSIMIRVVSMAEMFFITCLVHRCSMTLAFYMTCLPSNICWTCNHVPVTCDAMTTSWHGNVFYITGPLWGESTICWWISLTKGQWCRYFDFVISLNKMWINGGVVRDLKCHDILWHWCDVLTLKIAVHIKWNLVLGYSTSAEYLDGFVSHSISSLRHVCLLPAACWPWGAGGGNWFDGRLHGDHKAAWA